MHCSLERVGVLFIFQNQRCLALQPGICQHGAPIHSLCALTINVCLLPCNTLFNLQRGCLVAGGIRDLKTVA